MNTWVHKQLPHKSLGVTSTEITCKILCTREFSREWVRTFYHSINGTHDPKVLKTTGVEMGTGWVRLDDFPRMAPGKHFKQIKSERHASWQDDVSHWGKTREEIRVYWVKPVIGRPFLFVSLKFTSPLILQKQMNTLVIILIAVLADTS